MSMRELVGHGARAIGALSAGALVGSTLMTAIIVLANRELTAAGLSALPIAVVIFVASALVWLAGLCLVAPLPWYVLHRAGVRGPLPVAILGAVLAPMAVVTGVVQGFEWLVPDRLLLGMDANDALAHYRAVHSPSGLLRIAIASAAIGALVALVVDRIATRERG